MKKGIGPLCGFLLFVGLVRAENWPQWRGPEGLGISPEEGFAAVWGPDKNVRWRTAVAGEGHSSPIVWEDRIFLTTAIRGAQLKSPQAPDHKLDGKPFTHPDWEGSDFRWALKVLCFDRRSGRLLWDRTAFEGLVRDHRHRKNTYASSTPVTDGERVYAYFGREGLYAFDFEGNLVWSQQFRFVNTVGMGTATSPVLFEDRLILTFDQSLGEVGSHMVAFDKFTGEQEWRVERTARVSWVTPLIVSTQGRTEMIVAGTEQIVSYNPRSGMELWRCQGVESGLATPAVPSPVASDGVVFVSVGIQRKRAIAIRMGGLGDVTGTSRVRWEYDRGTGDVPSPLVYKGYLYLLSDNGIVTVLEASSGKPVYQQRLEVSNYTASPVAFQDKILFSDEEGGTTVIQAGPEFKVVAHNSIEEPILASPALSQGMLLLRSTKHLYSITAPEYSLP